MLKKDGGLAIGLSNFQSQLATLDAGFGLSPAEITAGSATCIDTSSKISASKTKKNESRQATQEKEISKKIAVTPIRRYSRRINAHPAYDTAKCQLKKIVSEDGAEQDKPLCNAIITPLGIQINFTKFQFDGVKVYRRRSNETVFQKLAFEVSPYIDNETLLVADQPDYYVVCVINDIETGETSDVMPIVYAG